MVSTTVPIGKLPKLPVTPLTAAASPAGSSDSDAANAVNHKLDIIIGSLTGLKRRLDVLEQASPSGTKEVSQEM